MLCLSSWPCGFLQELGGGSTGVPPTLPCLQRCRRSPTRRAALQQPRCTSVPAPALICCGSNLPCSIVRVPFDSFNFLFFFSLSSPPLLLCFLAQSALKLCSFFQHFFSLSVSPSGSPPMQIAAPRRWVGRKLGAALGPVSSLAFPNGGQEH